MAKNSRTTTNGRPRRSGTKNRIIGPDSSFAPEEGLKDYDAEAIGPQIRACEIRFCEIFMGGATYTEAFRQTHACDGLTDQTIGIYASRLANTERVKIYMDKIRKETQEGKRAVHVHITPSVNDTSPIIELNKALTEIQERGIAVTVQGQMGKLEVAYNFAIVSGKFAAAIAAVKAQNELAGFLTQRHEVTVKSLDGASDDDLAEMAEQARRELIELGLDPVSGIYTDTKGNVGLAEGLRRAASRAPVKRKQSGSGSSSSGGNLTGREDGDEIRKLAIEDNDLDWDD